MIKTLKGPVTISFRAFYPGAGERRCETCTKSAKTRTALSCSVTTARILSGSTPLWRTRAIVEPKRQGLCKFTHARSTARDRCSNRSRRQLCSVQAATNEIPSLRPHPIVIPWAKAHSGASCAQSQRPICEPRGEESIMAGRIRQPLARNRWSSSEYI